MPGQNSIIGRIIASILPPVNDGIVGRIVALPTNLQNNTQSQTIEGEVLQQNTNGNIRIRTAAGDIDIAVRDRNPPQAGQRVQVEIPNGNPPRQLIVRAADIPNGQTQRIATPQNQNPIPTQQTAQQQTTPPPTPVRLPDQVLATPRDTSATPPQRLEPGQVVRLLPLTPVQAQKIISQLPPQAQSIEASIPQQIVSRVNFQASIIAQNAQSSVEAQVLQIGKTSVEQIVRILSGNQPQAANQSQPQALQTSTQTIISAPVLPPTVFPLTTSGVQQIPQASQNLITQILNFQPSNIVPNAGQTPQLATQITLPTTPQAPQINLTQIAQNSFSIQNSVPANPQNILTSLTPVPAQTTAPRSSQGLDAQIFNIRNINVQITPPTQTQTPAQIFTNTIAQVQNPAFQITQSTPQNIPAFVIGKTAQGLPLVMAQTQALSLPQTFILQSPSSNIQNGTQIFIRPQTVSFLTQPTLPQTTPAPLQSIPLTQLLQPGAWPIMNDLYQGLLQVSPQAAQSLSGSIPNPASNIAQLTPAALMFVAAMRSGDFASWLGGKSVDGLQRTGKGNLINRLGSEMSSLNRGEATVSSEWRAVPLPMFWEGQIQKITLYTRQGRDDNSDDDQGDKQTRFVFDLDLTRMGPVQLDGLIKGQRLDMIVRTEMPFSEPMRQAMRQAYGDALKDTELRGDLDFQGDTKHWVNVLQKDEAFGANA
ncbi:MAG: hypothetical protein AAF569_01405 [Pseudomonadota bacterium]